ncbi:hypothetical protein [Echinicola shivajiensis]|uniref:hypothetical protein n=1 Tax=Echinicola shivajiensis TaxID=1035916 RepID=UPI001BFC3B35|nr:hypothetical protein [Echinicola shivajiensis]
MKIFIYSFRPSVQLPVLISKFRIWWKKELNENPEAVATEEHEVIDHTSLDSTDAQVNELLLIWTDLKKSHAWLMERI